MPKGSFFQDTDTTYTATNDPTVTTPDPNPPVNAPASFFKNEGGVYAAIDLADNSVAEVQANIASAAASKAAADVDATNAASSASSAATSASAAASSESLAATQATNAANSAAAAATAAATVISETVRYDVAQTLTTAQQLQARSNIALGNVAYVGSNLGFGDTNPQFSYTFNMNATQGFAPNGWKGWVFLCDDGDNGVGLNLLHVGAGGGITDARVNGTLASPANVTTGDQVGNFVYSGYGSGSLQGGRARMTVIATEPWTTTYGCYWELDATPTGGVRAQVMRAQEGVIFGQGTVDPGPENILVQGKVSVVNDTSPQYAVTISTNTKTAYQGPGAAGSGQLLTAVAADGVSTIVSVDTYRNGGSQGLTSQYVLATANGTAAAPTGLVAADLIGQYAFRGYDGSSWAANVARIIGITTATWTTSNHGTALEFDTTAAGGTSRTQAMRLASGLIVGPGTTDPGAGIVIQKTYTVSTLPAATGLAGAHAFVTDATATTFASVVAGGGTNGVPVYSDGTNWRIG